MLAFNCPLSFLPAFEPGHLCALADFEHHQPTTCCPAHTGKHQLVPSLVRRCCTQGHGRHHAQEASLPCQDGGRGGQGVRAARDREDPFGSGKGEVLSDIALWTRVQNLTCVCTRLCLQARAQSCLMAYTGC